MSLKLTNALEVERPGGGMSFSEFIVWSRHILSTAPNVKRLCEMRIARAFSSLKPVVDVPNSFSTVHRCDLAREWCEVRGLQRQDKTALVCEGVRQGLGLVLTVLARAGHRVALPRDVYPVYWRIASESGLEPLGFETFPAFDLRSILEAASGSEAFVVMLPMPLTLQGRDWTEEEVRRAVTWLREEPRRRLILDGLYSFGLPHDVPTKGLLETGQVIYLDSLSKGWLHELVLGVAVVPEQDLEIYRNSFRDLHLSQANLFRARHLLSCYRDFPDQLTKEIARKRDALQQLLAETGLRALPATRGYLIPVEASAFILLERHGFLTIPVTVFGCRSDQWSIASALPSAESP